MPKTNINYQNSLIYKICCKNPNIKDVYIGSTTNFKSRKNQHKSCCNNINNKSHNNYKYEFIRNNGGWNNWDMILIEKFPCNDSLELHKKEQEYIDEYNKNKIPLLNLCFAYNIAINQLFVKEPNEELINKIVEALGFENINSKQYILKSDLIQKNIIELFNIIIPEIRENYMNCKKYHCENLDIDKCINIARQHLKLLFYDIYYKQVTINNKKDKYYKIVRKFEKQFLQNKNIEL